MSSITRKGDHLQYPVLNLEAQGSLVAVATKLNRVERPCVGGKRGEITEFSKASRRRLIRFISRLRGEQATFITLTYAHNMQDVPEAKKHLRALLERFRRKYPHSSAIWRIEFQKRGAVHFHLLMYGLPYVPFWQLKLWWCAVSNQHEGLETLPFVRIELIRSRRGVMRYVSKYIAKHEAGSSGLFNYGAYLHGGRHWGVFNRAYLPFAELVRAAIPQITVVALRQIKRRWRVFWDGIDPDSTSGVVLLHDHAYLLYLEAVQIALRDMTLVL